ncbi:hypothetical protein KAK11_20390 [Ideonella paludis]|uniref:UspA domain-containing protein n=1 Tax=Ideonella paludis TaxID=1233411 RepID=A0ABS5E2Q7_9BURK|nr:hypothetical protein [Ideonella paludis]
MEDLAARSGAEVIVLCGPRAARGLLRRASANRGRPSGATRPTTAARS